MSDERQTEEELVQQFESAITSRRIAGYEEFAWAKTNYADARDALLNALSASRSAREDSERPKISADELSAFDSLLKSVYGESERCNFERWSYYIPGGWAGDRLAALRKKVAAAVQSEEGAANG